MMNCFKPLRLFIPGQEYHRYAAGWTLSDIPVTKWPLWSENVTPPDLVFVIELLLSLTKTQRTQLPGEITSAS